MGDDLKRKRGYQKGTLTRIEKNAANTAFINTATAIDLTIQLEYLEKTFNNFRELDEEICKTEDNDGATDMIDFEKRYLAVKSKLRALLKSKTEEDVSEKFNASIRRLSDQQGELKASIQNMSFVQKDEIKLPPVQVPVFSGNYAEFPTFRDMFEASIHNVANLSKVHKFKYLKSLLKGSAFDLIRHINVTDGNYEEAWAKIVERYNARDQICSALIQHFLEQPNSNGSPTLVRQLADKADEVVRGLKSLGEEAETRDVWIIYHLLQKCDKETRRAWMLKNEETFPKLQTLINFLVKHSNAFERAEAIPIKRNMQKLPVNNINVNIEQQSLTNQLSCPKCGDQHYLFNCDEFNKKSVTERREFVADKKLCFICMKSKHSAQHCRSKHRCAHCRRRHNTLLHTEEAYQSTLRSQSQAPTNAHVGVKCLASELATTNLSVSILPTALVKVKDGLGNWHYCKAMLDSGSQATFVDEKLSKKLLLKKKNARIAINGLATNNLITKGVLNLEVCSRINEINKINVEALILDKIPLIIPSTKPGEINLAQLKSLNLADPSFDTPAKIDLLLGADAFFTILRTGKEIISDTLIAQNTLFGYVISGVNQTNTSQGSISLHLNIDMNIDETLERFWQLEEIPLNQKSQEEEHPAETHFKETFKRNQDGRFIVRLPFKVKDARLGNSYDIARNRFYAVERKLKRNVSFKVDYSKFMREYVDLGHMREVALDKANNQANNYYLPHHAVIRSESLTTKLRVVFDGSCRTSFGTSLNQNLVVGPTIQPTLWSILLQFRTYRYVLTADIKKMYRQILVDSCDVDYQRILWRENEAESLKHFQLLTVTYGTAAAPFLATRCLYQLGEEESDLQIKTIIQNHFYVDDLLTGVQTTGELQSIKAKLTKTLASGGFPLHKWVSNIPEMSENDQSTLEMPCDNATSVKILGLQWLPSSDKFTFKVQEPSQRKQTKRIMLSEASRVFDPLGWVSPAIIVCKMLFQQLWLRKLDWDDELPEDISSQWMKLRRELHHFEKIEIPRFIDQQTQQAIVEYHGFSDASQNAYGAVVYCRIQYPNNEVKISLVTSKTKVASLKPISIPRLELCAAQLLAKLINSVAVECNVSRENLFAWTDSMVVLAWLNAHPSKWKQFVGNRTANILNLLPRKHWRYVPSECNPADLASRGVYPSKLIDSNLWWNGPTWLTEDPLMWPAVSNVGTTPIHTQEESRPGGRETMNLTINQDEHFIENLCTKTNSYMKLMRIIVYIMKLVKLIKSKQYTKLIRAEEIIAAEKICIKHIQRITYRTEIMCIKNQRQLPSSSKLKNVSPFLDEDEILRVGGRLENAELTFDEKHPVILPSSHPIITILIRHIHESNHHPGPTLTSFLLRQRYWVVNCRNTVKKLIYHCLICRRYAATVVEQRMAGLPKVRVTRARPFENVGIDYAGPITIATKRGRGAKLLKAYIAVFVCYCTKAIHLELVSSYTADSFIGALKRFVSRRGIPANIYCDNGTNFVGGDRKLRNMRKSATHRYDDIKKAMSHPEFMDEVLQYWAKNKTMFHFNPPLAPNFGGLYESVVKMTKNHLVKASGKTNLTAEETATLLCEIEAILNSRPLCQVSSDDSTYYSLTPGHFLIGTSLKHIPETSKDTTTNLGTQWVDIQRRVEIFWQRFQLEYLNSLQQRQKWFTINDNLHRGEIVLLKDVNLPPSHWPLGIIEQIHPGDDGLVRVITIRTQNSVYKRPISKIIRLPVQRCKE